MDILQMVKRFHAEAGAEHIGELSLETVLDYIQSEEAEGRQLNTYLLIQDYHCVGILHGKEHSFPGMTKRIFQEVFVYVLPSARNLSRKFINEVEVRLKNRGIALVIMTALSNYHFEGLKRFYSMLGYKPMETHLVKDLQWAGQSELI